MSKVKQELLMILFLPALMYMVLTIFNVLFKTSFDFERFKTVFWIIPAFELVLIPMWYFFTAKQIKMNQRLRFIIYNGVALWGIPVGATLFINNFCTKDDFIVRDGIMLLLLYLIMGIIFGAINYRRNGKI